jgi:aminobenzoyl-glutamate transport protein
LKLKHKKDIAMKVPAILDAIERAGNKLPNPTMLFVFMCGLVLLLSTLTAALGFSAAHPITGEKLQALNLISVQGLHRILGETVSNFVTFAPVGTVLVAIMGIGIAEHSGLLGSLLRATVLKAPPRMLTFAVVLAGVLSSLAADAGYVVLVPLAALIFQSAGRHPLAGIAAAFAGVSGGYSANLLITPLDAILAGISTEAAALVDPGYSVNAAGNYYFIIVSTLVISLVGTLVTEKIVCRRLPGRRGSSAGIEPLAAEEKRGLLAVAGYTVVFIGLLLWALVPESGILRDPTSQSVLGSPFIQGIVTVIAVYTAVAGIIFGKVSGHYSRSSEFVEGMEQHMATMAGYLVLMFFAAQFVNYFAWSNLGSIIAIKGAGMLSTLDLSAGVLLMMFIVMSACINLFIGSSSAKWALIAPIFVPMLMLIGISPESTQMAYRIGDSSTNIITPLMPYFGVVIAFAQRYDKHVGIGTLVAMMLPYSVAFLLSWSALLLLWIICDWPLGPSAPIFMQ